MSDPIYEAQAYEIAKMARSISALEVENTKLVDVLHEVEAEAINAYRCLQQDCETTTNSSQHFFDKWWHAECELDRLKTENTKLRELARRLLTAYRYIRLRPRRVYLEHEKRMRTIENEMRELGIEVDES